MTKKEKRPLVPRLRFPEFRESAEWGKDKLGELTSTVSPPSKLQSSLYRTKGKFPIIDQSQEPICGWTDDESAVIKESLPLIVFGDHTCVLKFIDYPFAQGADGIKILKAKPVISTEYLFHSLSHRQLAMEDYKRHFSILKERVVVFPDIKSGEQQKIGMCLSSLEGIITAEIRKLDSLKTYRKGLMQQLFPCEGEAVPRLRFPEFRELGDWEPKTIGDSCESFSGGTPATTNRSFYGGDVPFIRSAEIDNDKTELFLSLEGLENSAAKIVEAGDILVALYGANSGDVALSKIDGAINQAILCLRHETNNAFLYQYLAHKKDWIVSTFIQGGQGNLSGEIIKAIRLFFPMPKEQQRIANCLSSLDYLVATQNQKIGALKTHKKGLMQQIIPVPEEVST